MDVLTPRGQESRAQEDRAIAIWQSRFPHIAYIHTPKDSPAVVDAILVRDGQIVGVVETKCRPQLTVLQFSMDYQSRWLVTKKKIDDGVQTAKSLCVPYVGFLFLPDADLLLYQTIWRPGEGYVCDITIADTRTQATINGGSIVRTNAFIDMSKAKFIAGDENERRADLGTVPDSGEEMGGEGRGGASA